VRPVLVVVEQLVVGHEVLAAQELAQLMVAEPAALAGEGAQTLAEPGMVLTRPPETGPR
jgi:hypothetical protein